MGRQLTEDVPAPGPGRAAATEDDGALRRSQHQQVAATSGGRMTVEKQSYIQQPASRIPVATTITNVVATCVARPTRTAPTW